MKLKYIIPEYVGKVLYPFLFLISLLSLSMMLEGCEDQCQNTRTYTYYEPVYTTIPEVRAGIMLTGPQPIQQVGKIYYKDGFLFVNDPGKGIHIINNLNPASPQKVKFLKIPGNYELAIKGNTLYADSYVDLVAFDISDLSSIQAIKRIEGIFSNYTSVYSSMGLYANNSSCCVISGWKQRSDVTITLTDCEANVQSWGGIFWRNGIAVSDASFAAEKMTMTAPVGGGSGNGIGGSMARFTLSQDHLYVLNQSELYAVDVTKETEPVMGNKVTVAWDIETIFPYKRNLFIGSRTGMHIFDITNPSLPVKVSTYAHVRSCDPVIVDGDYAYVTLRNGNITCSGYSNQLEVINIQNLKNPHLVKIYPMTNPHGLGKDGPSLFICDGNDGLKVFNASNVLTINENLLAHYSNINAFDVIPYNKVAMMIGSDGIFQYDYSDLGNITLLSKIPLN